MIPTVVQGTVKGVERRLLKAGSPRPVKDVGVVLPPSFHRRRSRVSSPPLSSNVKCTSFQSLLGAGLWAAGNPRLRRIPGQTLDSPPAQPSLPEASQNTPYTRRQSAVPSAAQNRSFAARSRAGVAHLQSVTQGRLGRGCVEVGGTDQGRAGAGAGRRVAELWEQRLALARRHSTAGVWLAGPCSSAASHPPCPSPRAQRPGQPAGAGVRGGLCARMNGRRGGRARSGLKGIRTVRIAPRSCLSLSPPTPHLSPFSALQD